LDTDSQLAQAPRRIEGGASARARQLESHPNRWSALVLALFALIFLSTPLLEWRSSYFSTADLTQDYSLVNVDPGHQPGNRLLSDPVLQMQPWLMFSRSELRQGRLPLWNPYNGGGAPHLANFQSAVFSLFSLPYYVFDVRTALLVSAFAALYGLGLFTFLFLRELECAPLPALVGATAFMFCGHNALLLGYPHPAATIALPAGLFFAERVLRALDRGRETLRGSGGSLVGLSLSLTVALLAGQPEPFLFCVLLLACWVSVRLLAWLRQGPRDRTRVRAGLRTGGALLFAGLLPAGLAAFQLLPFVEYLRESTILALRSNLQPGLPLSNWPLFFFPDLLGNPSVAGNPSYTLPAPNFEAVNTSYIGSAALLLALASLAFVRRDRAVRFFASGACVWLAVAYDLVGASSLLQHVPLLSLAPLNRSQPIGLFCISVCAALGLHHLGSIGLRERLRTRLGAAAVLTGAAALLIAALLGARALLESTFGASLPEYASTHVPRHLRFVGLTFSVAALATAWLTLARSLPMRRAALGCVLGTVFLQGGWLFRNYNTTTRDELFYPRTPAIEQLAKEVDHRALVVLSEDTLPPNVNLAYGITLLTNYDTIWIGAFDELFRTVFQGAHGNWRNTLSCTEQALRLFGVDYVLTLGEWVPVETPLSSRPPSTPLVAHPLRAGSRIEQEFAPEQPGLAAFAVWLSVDPQAERSTLLVRLERVSDGALAFEKPLDSQGLLARLSVRRRTLFPSEIYLPVPGRETVLRFPVERQAGARYRLTLEAPRGESSGGWTAWSHDAPPPQCGNFTVDGARQAGALLFDWSATLRAFRPVCSIGPYVLWRYGNKRGRAWIVHDVAGVEDERAAFQRVLSASFDPNAAAVLVGPSLSVPESPGDATDDPAPEIVEEQPSLLKLRVSLEREGWLVLARSWYPGWRARLDGAEVPLLRANYAFQAVHVPTGAHEVELAYEPRLFQIGLWVSAASAVLGFCVLWRLRSAASPLRA
jgi:membrane protein YfhO